MHVIAQSDARWIYVSVKILSKSQSGVGATRPPSVLAQVERDLQAR